MWVAETPGPGFPPAVFQGRARTHSRHVCYGILCSQMASEVHLGFNFKLEGCIIVRKGSLYFLFLGTAIGICLENGWTNGSVLLQTLRIILKRQHWLATFFSMGIIFLARNSSLLHYEGEVHTFPFPYTLSLVDTHCQRQQ